MGDFGQRHRLVGARDLDRALLEHQVLDRDFEQLAGDQFYAFCNLFGCGGHRTTRHHHAARAPGAGGVGREPGIAMNQAHVVGMDAEDLVGDLRQRGLQALAVRLRADAQLQHAVGRQARKALLMAGHHRDAPAEIDRGAVRALFAVDRDAHADLSSVGFTRLLARAPSGQVDGGNRTAHGFWIVTRIEVLVGDVVVGHVLARNQIREANFIGFAPRGARHRVDHQFERKAHPGARHAAVGQDRRLVGRG